MISQIVIINQSCTCIDRAKTKFRGRLRLMFAYYLILFVIPKVLHEKLSSRSLCLLFGTLCLQNILAFVRNKATPCFVGCKGITVTSLKNYVISECYLLFRPSPRFTKTHSAQWSEVRNSRTGAVHPLLT